MKKQAAKTRTRRRAHVRRRAGIEWLNRYSLQAVMNTGLDKIRSLKDLRDRQQRMAEDDGLYERIERYFEAAKHEHAELQALREYMQDNYGGGKRR